MVLRQQPAQEARLPRILEGLSLLVAWPAMGSHGQVASLAGFLEQTPRLASLPSINLGRKYRTVLGRRLKKEQLFCSWRPVISNQQRSAPSRTSETFDFSVTVEHTLYSVLHLGCVLNHKRGKVFCLFDFLLASALAPSLNQLNKTLGKWGPDISKCFNFSGNCPVYPVL